MSEQFQIPTKTTDVWTLKQGDVVKTEGGYEKVFKTYDVSPSRVVVVLMPRVGPKRSEVVRADATFEVVQPVAVTEDMTVEQFQEVMASTVFGREPEGASMFRFTDQALQEAVDGAVGVGLLHERQAGPLLGYLDTPARRKRAYEEAQTRQNLRGGRLSVLVHSAALDLKRQIKQGNEGDLMWAERAADDHRKAENEMRRLTGRQVILYPPEMRRV